MPPQSPQVSPDLDQVTVRLPVPEARPAQPVRVGPPPSAATTTEVIAKPGKRGRKLLLVGVSLVVVAALGVGGVLAGPWVAQQLGLAGPDGFGTQAPPVPVNPQMALRALPKEAPTPTPAGVAAALDGLAGNAALGQLTGSVLDASTGGVLWERGAGEARTPASTGKVLTAAAALLALDHRTRFTTTVVAGPEPGTVVLVGGGDPTLSALPANKPTYFFPDAARVDDLAEQVKAKAGGPVRKIIIDVGRYTGPALASGWLPADVAGGHVAPMVPLMVDSGRQNVMLATTPRTDKPAQAAGQELAKRLGNPPVEVGTAPAGAQELAKVSSPALPSLVAAFLSTSDNVLAEAVARETAKGTGNDPSFAGAAKATLDVLGRNGIDVAGVKMSDGSGLSSEDQVPAKVLSALLAAAAGGDERAAKLRPLLTGLPVAGGTGTLSKRYERGANATGKGWVRAKTGTLSGVNSLAGTVTTNDGRLLVFSFMATGANNDAAREALDALASSLRKCGCAG
ncbi:D-alanyl-D-alanine carboxypeptidase/D-alanyl-D-alanine-endopeptidase (penicillin-binding protein 4) [Crossiella equi]|uniref:D-alanyl-D-alanine carboxypeptidase/D-alanyl-D-alanine-endopeptidase (Penicillin-binding protein 4) n=1 Tax=Crossiella equi TaxID=130796 RepID=A0ABS5AF58_9PSEU|nr:D-alanyl-D-alanine carboxypeptidase/D-alanyl-D-alanine-endopeptidase [Crossiella equi]MBP2475216.1 D-alanyl-D-alanine carboxypeptidase/D-alanyl-D-alanine-endopeptidase (penicillin-binding protein 4) [Crossiella equi]